MVTIMVYHYVYFFSRWYAYQCSLYLYVYTSIHVRIIEILQNFDLMMFLAEPNLYENNI